MAAVIHAPQVGAERVVLPARVTGRGVAAPQRATTSPVMAPAVDPLRAVDPAAAATSAPAHGPRADADISPGSIAAAMHDATPFDPEADVRVLRERLARERDEVLARAHDDGYAQGLAEGRATLEAELDSLEAVLQSLRASLDRQVAGAEDIIVDIAFEALGRMLGTALVTREGAVAAVREVLGTIGEREQLTVRVAPGDYELVLGARTQLAAGDDGRMLDIVPDERVALGGCLVETAGGTLDGRLETQLARIVETLSSVRRAPTEPVLA